MTITGKRKCHTHEGKEHGQKLWTSFGKTDGEAWLVDKQVGMSKPVTENVLLWIQY
jgi:hypothetical protein